jgi:hypothetical protein
MRKFFLPFTLLMAICSCNAIDSMKEGFQHAEAVAEDLQQTVGSKPKVGFNWNNGSLTQVSIIFNGVQPGKSTDQIADAARAAIKAQFKQIPKEIVLGFSIKP